MFLLCLTTFYQLTVAIRIKPKALNMVYKALRGLLSQSASHLHLMLHFSISMLSQLDFSQVFDHSVLFPASILPQIVPSALRACPKFFRSSQTFPQRKLP